MMKAVIALLAVAFLASVYCNESIKCKKPVYTACFVEPCSSAKCPGVEGAVCKNDYCRNSCDTKWFLGDVDVSGKCGY